MHLSSRVKLISTCGLLFAIVISLTLFGATRGISHASGTLPQSSTRIGVISATTTSSCGSWQIVPIRQPSGLDFDELNRVVALSTSNVWAVGYANGALIEHWNGKQWSVVVSSQAVSSNLFAVTALSANNIWAVGWRGAATGNFEPLIEHWNGSSWSIVRSAKNGTGSIFLAVAQIPRTSKLWAVGLHYKDNNNYANLFTEFSC